MNQLNYMHCGKCGKVYSSEEFQKLNDHVEVRDKQRVVYRSCSCGYRFWDDRFKYFRLFDKLTIKTPFGILNIEISTVHLEINHGTDEKPQWYETLITCFEKFVEYEKIVRYESELQAQEGHRKIVEKFKNFDFQLKPQITYTLEIDLTDL